MKVVIPSDSNHTIKIIPRDYPLLDITLNLYNESDKTDSDIVLVYNTDFTVTDGYFTFSFDYDFAEGDKFQIKLYRGAVVYYRGKLIATAQTPQDYSQTDSLYYYG